MLDKICEDLLEKYKENRMTFNFDSEYKTPLYHKTSSERFSTSTTFESEAQSVEAKWNREKVGNDLKLQWSQMMKEFEHSTKKQLTGLTPLCAELNK